MGFILGGSVAGRLPPQGADIRKFFPQIMEGSGAMVDDGGQPVTNYLFADPAKVTDDSFTATISSALLDYTNPDRMQRAVRIVDAISAVGNLELAKSVLTAQAAQVYDYVSPALEFAPDGIEGIAGRIIEGRRRHGNKQMTWSDYGAAEAPQEAERAVNNRIASTVDDVVGQTGLLGLFGHDVSIPQSTLAAMKSYALLDMGMRDGEGWDWKRSVDNSVRNLIQRAEVLPAFGGKYVLSLDTDRPTYWFDQDGDMHERTRLGFAVPNPNTRQFENTVAVYETDVATLGALFPVLFDDGAPDGVTLFDDPLASAAGGYAMKHDGEWMVYELGREYDVPAKVIAPIAQVNPLTGQPIPAAGPLWGSKVEYKRVKIETEDDLMEAFDMMPDAFFFYEVVADGGVAYALGYRPNFGDDAGMSIDQREREYDQNNPPRPTFGPTMGQEGTAPIGPARTGGRF